MHRIKNRTNSRGNTLAETPAIIFVLVLGVFFPMVVLGSITLRATFLSVTAKDAAHAAAKAKTFQTGEAEKPSAIDIANSVIAREGPKFSGISASSIKTSIVSTDVTSGSVTRSSAPLTNVDTSRNVYAIEVAVNGKVEPIIRCETGFFGNVPGLTSPMPLTVVACEMSENPQGLNK